MDNTMYAQLDSCSVSEHGMAELAENNPQYEPQVINTEPVYTLSPDSDSTDA